MADQVWKVKYNGGSGVRLTHPLTDGRVELPGHEVIELTDYGDFKRLTSSKSWVEVKDEAPAAEPPQEENKPENKVSGGDKSVSNVTAKDSGTTSSTDKETK